MTTFYKVGIYKKYFLQDKEGEKHTNTFEEFILVNLQTFQQDGYQGHKGKEPHQEIYDASYDGNKFCPSIILFTFIFKWKHAGALP